MKRIISALLLVSMLILASCAGDSGSKPDPAANDTSAQTTETTETVSTEPESYVPEDLDFDGRKVTLLGYDNVFEAYVMASDLTGDSLNDALYERYQRVGSQLNVTFDFVKETSGGIVDKINATVLAGDDVYQLAIGQRATSIGKMVGSKLLANWNDLISDMGFPSSIDARKYWSTPSTISIFLNSQLEPMV